jgi:hypothetical protein
VLGKIDGSDDAFIWRKVLQTQMNNESANRSLKMERTKFMNTKLLITLCCAIVWQCGNAQTHAQLYTEGPGVNPPFEDIRDSISNGYSGTVIDVNNALVEGGAFGELGIQGNLRLHTLASSSIAQNRFGNWSRWYQTDGATQIFRLFPGEENVRNSRALAARIEAFDAINGWNVDDGEWHEWVARYTIIKPINASIFQAKDQDAEDWSVHINMNAAGRVSLTHRRPMAGQPKTEVLVENAIGQPFDIRIRDNGLDYEVYFGDLTTPFASGQFVRNADPADNSDTRFRWGIYVGAQEVETEAMIFVSHASVDPDIEYPDPVDPVEPVDPNYGELIAGWHTWSQVGPDRWDATEVNGVTAQAAGTHEAGGAWYNFDNSLVENGASSDGEYGASGVMTEATSVAAPTDGVTLSNGFDGFIDFTLTDTTGEPRVLDGFHFDTGAFRPNAATDWQLEILAGGDLSSGSVATGVVSVNAGPIQDDESIDLSMLSDNTLDANGTVTFRLNFTGGGGDAGAAQGGHHIFLDNVAITSAAASRLGDFDNDGDVDLDDLDRYNGNLGVDATGELEALDLDADGLVGVSDFETHYGTLVETTNGEQGTLAGDLNLNGIVDVLGDAFALVSNLGNTGSSWSQGDMNADRIIDVLGDAFALVANLGRTNAQ